jgi:hypothetical protein
MSSIRFDSNLIGSDRIGSDRFGSDRIGPVRFRQGRLGPVRFGSVLTNVLHTTCSSNVDVGIHCYRITGTYPCIVLLLDYVYQVLDGVEWPTAITRVSLQKYRCMPATGTAISYWVVNP